MEEFVINGEYITISALLKVLGIIQSGGEAKSFLLENKVLLDGVEIIERKKKIFPNSVVTVNNQRIYLK